MKKYNLQDRRYLFQKENKNTNKTTKLWLKNKTKRTVETQDQIDRRTVETQSLQRNSGNTEPYRGTVKTQNQAEEQWKHRTIQNNSGNTEQNNRTVETQDQAEEQ